MSNQDRKRNGKIEICRSEDGQYYFRLKSGNGEIICNGEMHPSKQAAIRSSQAMESLCSEPLFLEDMTKAKK